MIRIFILKLLGSILSLWLISLLIFFLSKAVPGDPVRANLTTSDNEAFEMEFESEYSRIYRDWNLDLPEFYFSLLPRNFPNDLNEILPIQKQEWIRSFLFQGYQYEYLSTTFDQLVELKNHKIPIELETNYKLDVDKLFSFDRMKTLSAEIEEFSFKYYKNEQQKPSLELDDVNNASFLNMLPSLRWNGLQNQYHIWFSNFIRGHMGVSYIDQRSVWSKIQRSIGWTFFFVFLTLVLSYALGIALGVLLDQMKQGFLNVFIERLIFGIYAIPLFWLATLLLVFFTTSEYGRWTNIFPSVGLAPIDTGESWFVRIWEYGRQLILPVFCLVLHNLAFLATLTKRNLNRSGKQAFVLTSKSFGYSKSEILKRDILPHSLLPLITSLTSAIPAAFGGSLVIEIIFNIPGMGRLMYNGVLNNDWPLVFGVVMLIATLSILSFWLAEVLYRWADPRLRIKKTA